MRDFKTDEACLRMVFQTRYGQNFECPKCHKTGRFNLILKRKRFDCQCGYGLYPLAGTIFHGSATPIRLWFYAIYLFAYNRDGVAAKELERKLGVTYKTAWRISTQIRSLFTQPNTLFDTDKQAGAVSIFASNFNIPRKNDASRRHMKKSARLSSTQTSPAEYLRERFKSRLEIYVQERLEKGYDVTFWVQLLNSLEETHHIISPKYLQSYVDEVVFRYNNRRSPNKLFSEMLHQAITRKQSSA